MILLELTPNQRADLQAMRRDRTLKPSGRDPIEMALLSDAGITFFFLPPHSPKRNAIEARFRGVKHDDLLERTDT